MKDPPSGPYTNVLALNLDKCRKNTVLTKYISSVKNSNNIYIYRWGDLPLWGEVANYFLKRNDVLLTKQIKYYHESHSSMVN